MDVDLDSSPEYIETGEQRSPEVKKRGPKKKKKKGLTEPQKPVSAYALFFRDTQAAIKAENSMATFGEISKIVASMWDSLSEEAKQVYKQKTESAKREYLKQLAAYRANCAAKQDDAEEDDSTPLVYLKEKMTEKRVSPTLSNQILPPPPKLQMAPVALTKNISKPATGNFTAANVASPITSQNNGVTSHSPSAPTNVSQNSSAGASPVIPPPIQLRNIVPKAQGPITILQSKPGQVIKLLPASQATDIANRCDGAKPRILKMTDLIRYDSPPSPNQITAPANDDVQPILQTLEEESGSLQRNPTLERNGKKTNGIDSQTGEVIIIDEGDSPEAQSSEETPMETNSGYRTPSVRVCVRDGCPNLAVSDPQWNDEYCSASCAVEHCRDVFDAWVSVRQVNASAS